MSFGLGLNLGLGLRTGGGGTASDNLKARLNGQADLEGTLQGIPRNLAGSLTGSANLTGNVSVIKELAGSFTGSADLVGDLTKQSSYDPDAQAYFNRVEGPAGDNQTLETAVKDAINAFVVGCKADGIWNAIKASCIIAGARTLNGALQPLVGTAPTNFNFVSADYNRKTGLKGDGSTKYLDTNVAPSDGLQDNAHYSTHVTSLAGVTNKDYIGATQTTPFNSFSQIIDNSGALNATLNMGAGFGLPNGSGNAYTGFFGADRPSASSINARYNGTISSTSVGSVTPASLNYFVFGRNLNNAPDRLSDRAHTFYSIGESLDLALLDARITTLVSEIGAAIP